MLGKTVIEKTVLPQTSFPKTFGASFSCGADVFWRYVGSTQLGLARFMALRLSERRLEHVGRMRGGNSSAPNARSNRSSDCGHEKPAFAAQLKDPAKGDMMCLDSSLDDQQVTEVTNITTSLIVYLRPHIRAESELVALYSTQSNHYSL